MFIVDEKRVATMRRHLGKASELILDDAYLPMFRNRQKNNPVEFEKSVEIAKTKRNPARFFAAMWSLKNLNQSLVWLREAVARAAAKIADKRRMAKERRQEARLAREYNHGGRARLRTLYSRHGLVSLKS